MGISIAWVKSAFSEYYRAEMRLHQWRLDLANQVELIEQEMQKRQDERNEDPNPWWWVPFVRDLLTELAVEMVGGEALVILYHFGRGNTVDALIELMPFDRLIKSVAGGLKVPKSLDEVLETMADYTNEASPAATLGELPSNNRWMFDHDGFDPRDYFQIHRSYVDIPTGEALELELRNLRRLRILDSNMPGTRGIELDYRLSPYQMNLLTNQFGETEFSLIYNTQTKKYTLYSGWKDEKAYRVSMPIAPQIRHIYHTHPIGSSSSPSSFWTTTQNSRGYWDGDFATALMLASNHRQSGINPQTSFQIIQQQMDGRIMLVTYSIKK